MDRKKDQIIVELRKFKKTVQVNLGVSKLILFGSQATGTAKAESDVDLVMVSPRFSNMPFWKRFATARKFFELRMPVDILCFTPEEFEKKKNQITIVREAVDTGIEI